MMNELDIINWDKKLLTNDFTEKDLSYLATLSTEYQAENNEKKYLQNYDALKDLKKKQAIYNEIIALSSGATVLGTATSNPILAGIGSVIAATSIELSPPVDRLVFIMEMLLEHYGDVGIILTPDVKTDRGKIDLLIKMPDRRTFALILRSKGDSLVRWHTESGNFFVRTRSKGGRNRRVYDELLKSARRLNEMTLSLKKEKSYLLGATNVEKKQPIVKVLVFTSKTRIDPHNDPSLFVDFGRARVLHIQSDCSIYVADHSDLVNFLSPDEKKLTN